MHNIFFALKQQATVLSFLLMLSLLAFTAWRFLKKKLAFFLIVFATLIFLASSTAYLPRYLTKQLENKYLPFNPASITNKSERIYIHVLGSGYNLDMRLPATSQIGVAAIGRLAEALRIYRQLSNSVIVCSANSMVGLETQASVTKRAAILLGADSSRVDRLDTPSTTQEEAIALHAHYGNKIKVIIISDAMHLPRAMKLFEKEGFDAIAAPTNFKVPEDSKQNLFGWWPATVNINLMDLVLHEYLARLK